MSTNARQGWNAAQRAAEREPQKPRNMHGPVGDAELSAAYNDANTRADRTWKCCGFHVHVSTCPTQKPKKSLAAKTAERRMEQIALHASRGSDMRQPQYNGDLTLLEAAAACREGKVVS